MIEMTIEMTEILEEIIIGIIIIEEMEEIMIEMIEDMEDLRDLMIEITTREDLKEDLMIGMKGKMLRRLSLRLLFFC